MTIVGVFVALFAGCLAGILNSVAGGGSVVTYPILLALGVPPISANMTSSVGNWPGLISSAYGYRSHIRKLRKGYFWLLLPAALGGLIGAIILSRTSTHVFQRVAPWFILLAVFLFALRPNIHTWLYASRRRAMSRNRHVKIMVITVIALLAVAIYGGFFGPGSGIILLGAMGFTRLTDLQEMNGLKNLLTGSINLTANTYFIVVGVIYWQFAAPMLVGNLIGGWLGAAIGTRISQETLKFGIIIIGVIVAGLLMY